MKAEHDVIVSKAERNEIALRMYVPMMRRQRKIEPQPYQVGADDFYGDATETPQSEKS